jgi:hypothetical protein
VVNPSGIGAAPGRVRLPSIKSSPERQESEEAPPAGLRSRPLDRSESRRPEVHKDLEVGSRPRTIHAAESRRASGTRLSPVAESERPTNATAKGALRASRERIFERIIAATPAGPALPGTRLQLVVRSPEWGALRIELTVKGSEVRASLRAECEEARKAIVSRLDDLRARLEGRGLRLGAFQVSVGQQEAEEKEPVSGPRSVRPQLLDLTV